jgi:hypothetical protein
LKESGFVNHLAFIVTIELIKRCEPAMAAKFISGGMFHWARCQDGQKY